MNPGNSFTTFAMAAGLLAGLLVLGAHTVRRISAREQAGGHRKRREAVPWVHPFSFRVLAGVEQ